MKARSTRMEPNRQIIDEAAAWFVDLRVGDVDAWACDEFNTWLRRSPEHIQAYLEIAGTYIELPAPNPHGQLDIERLIAAARDSADVTPLRPASPQVRRYSGPEPRSRFHRFPLALAAAILLTVAGAWLYSQRGTYTTGVGEQRSIILADGSTVELNARSRISIRFSDHERSVDLLEGQALFEVAKDPVLPFFVRSEGARVRAVGTQFDVYRKQVGTVVTVVEGKVAVFGTAQQGTETPRLSAVATPIFLAAGEQLVITPVAIEPPKPVDVAAATAWTQRRLVFDHTPLTDVAYEFNRYSARAMTVDATGLEDFHISGTYSSANPDSLLRFLHAQPNLLVTETDREIHIARQ